MTEKRRNIQEKLPLNFSIIVTIIFILLTIIAVYILQKYAPILTLKGKNNITINYKEKYIEPGYKLTIDKIDKTKKVKITGKVNSKKLGRYIIKYSYKKGIFKTTKKRIVKVKDLTKPVIILNGSKETYICPNSEYTESGYTATDNYDGDITKKVKREVTENEIIYKVVDKSNNKTIIKRKILKEDITKPTIILKGQPTVNLQIGQVYQEEGYTATDNCDGDITNKVTIDNKVDSNTIGTYKIIYTVTDNNQNNTTVERIVNINKKTPIGTIYLTFDDGPRYGTTDKILDILKEENVKVTFFVTNSGPDELIKRAYDEGHTIALHTATHNYGVIYSSKEAYFNDLKQVQDRVERITGYHSMIIRFPGGSSNTVSRKYSQGIMSILTREVLSRGYKYYDWNISSGDAGETKSSDGVYSNVVSRLSHDKVNMVLMHDIKPYTRDALKRIIDYAKQNNYIFSKIDETTEMISQKVNN